MTKPQQIFLHTALRDLRRTRDVPDEWYREALHRLGGVTTSTDLDNAGFERVMAWLEECGWRDTKRPADHWRTKADLLDRYANERVVRKIEAAIAGTPYTLGALCERFSDGRTSLPAKLRPREAYNLIEMLKAVTARQEAMQT